jgi:hypothetical protein
LGYSKQETADEQSVILGFSISKIDNRRAFIEFGQETSSSYPSFEKISIKNTQVWPLLQPGNLDGTDGVDARAICDLSILTDLSSQRRSGSLVPSLHRHLHSTLPPPSFFLLLLCRHWFTLLLQLGNLVGGDVAVTHAIPDLSSSFKRSFQLKEHVND